MARTCEVGLALLWNWCRSDLRCRRAKGNPHARPPVYAVQVWKARRASQSHSLQLAGGDGDTDESRILDAPNLRDDFYCSVLAYSQTCEVLAMGLRSHLYAWTEEKGVICLRKHASSCWISSLDFSSTQGGKSILAYGLADGRLCLMTPDETGSARFEIAQSSPVVYVSWRPVVTVRPSKNPRNAGVAVQTEDLLVGNYDGYLLYYVVEWPMRWEVERDSWAGTVTLVARIKAHTQQICGLAWAPSGDLFASGANDNHCCLFSVSQVFGPPRQQPPARGVNVGAEDQGSEIEPLPRPVLRLDAEETAAEEGAQVALRTMWTNPTSVRNMLRGSERHRWVHAAAVKAIAFCPWLEGLVATGGGSNDKSIHFWHATTGVALATITVCAQVTSLIWSTTRREIAATFGYPQPDHPYRVAIFSWPECRQVAAIAWPSEHRALYAIPYPYGPRHSPHHGQRRRPDAEEGCIVVAGSDRVVRFHEVWSAGRRAMVGRSGMLAGSDILEGLEGMDKEGDVIR